MDPRTADVIVGTSAGSITGTLLRSGVQASDLAAWTVRSPLSAEGHVLNQIVGAEVPRFQPFNALHVVRRPPSLPGRKMLQRALLQPRHFRSLAASLALLAPGAHDIAEQLTTLREVEGQDWPERDLWICAVRRQDGRRVVFGRPGGPDAPLHLATAASCAVPGYFTPIRIGDRSYVDGGAHSPTNATILREADLDLVIIVSPMSGPAGAIKDVYAASRWHAVRIARREVQALRKSGVDVVVFRPGPSEQVAMGNDFMARDRVDETVQQSFWLPARTPPSQRSESDSGC